MRNIRRMQVLVAVAALSLIAASCTLDADESAFSVLVFSKTAGYRHESIEAGIAAIRTLGVDSGFKVDASEDATRFTNASLAGYRVVVFLNTTGTILDAEQRRALQTFIESGGGFVGVHAASDTEYDWPWYGQLVGAYFKSHPDIQRARIRVIDRIHPSTRSLPRTWPRTDEWYNFRQSPAASVRVLATLDEASYRGGDMGVDHPIAWCREFDGGRAWYTALGHTVASYGEPLFRQHLLGGILWAAGREAAGNARVNVTGSLTSPSR
ncbi:MAG TPA: ThuA domain-containing protein [Candidatus Cybelea sp.]|nr:ThuA domain-containing protein [Candidatus Cybelea sp.]